MLALDATCIMMTMKSLSSSAVAASRELSSSRCHPCIRPNKCNIPGTCGMITIPNSRQLWLKNTNIRSSSFSSLAISSDRAVAAAAATASDPELTWQILVGALGIFYLTSLYTGVTPFIVAAIEFSKRIVAQKKCEICQGSGLVLMDKKEYIRCPDCGGFLPWQSWKRFFSEIANFRFHEDGMVQVSGTVDPVVLLKVMGRSGKEVQIVGWKFGGCSRNLHMPEYQPYDLAAIHAAYSNYYRHGGAYGGGNCSQCYHLHYHNPKRAFQNLCQGHPAATTCHHHQHLGY